MKYGIKCTSTMCGLTFYIIEETWKGCEEAFNEFKKYLNDEPNHWELYCSVSPVYCDEDTVFSVGKTEAGTYVLITDLGCGIHEENKAIEFKLIRAIEDRF